MLGPDMLVPLVGLGCLIVMLVAASIIGKHVKCDQRCLYLSSWDFYKMKDEKKLKKTTKEYFVL